MKRAGDPAIPMQSDGRTIIGSQHLFGTDIGELLLGYCHICRSSVENAIRGRLCYLELTKFGMVGRNRTSNPAVEKICVFGEAGCGLCMSKWSMLSPAMSLRIISMLVPVCLNLGTNRLSIDFLTRKKRTCLQVLV